MADLGIANGKPGFFGKRGDAWPMLHNGHLCDCAGGYSKRRALHGPGDRKQTTGSHARPVCLHRHPQISGDSSDPTLTVGCTKNVSGYDTNRLVAKRLEGSLDSGIAGEAPTLQVGSCLVQLSLV